MKEIEPHVKEIVFHIPEGYNTINKWLEAVGRTCYKSENKITENSAPKFIRMLRDRGHYAIIEHAVASARFVADRGLSHELVRHRIASYAQESTRYCNYTKGKFNNEISVIVQPGIPDGLALKEWREAMCDAEKHYFKLIKLGVKPEIARSVLPIGLKSEIVITTNLREWIHIFEMRCSKFAHPIIRGISLDVLNAFNNRLPSIYETQAKKFLYIEDNCRH